MPKKKRACWGAQNTNINNQSKFRPFPLIRQVDVDDARARLVAAIIRGEAAEIRSATVELDLLLNGPRAGGRRA